MKVNGSFLMQYSTSLRSDPSKDSQKKKQDPDLKTLSRL